MRPWPVVMALLTALSVAPQASAQTFFLLEDACVGSSPPEDFLLELQGEFAIFTPPLGKFCTKACKTTAKICRSIAKRRFKCGSKGARDVVKARTSLCRIGGSDARLCREATSRFLPDVLDDWALRFATDKAACESEYQSCRARC